MTTSQKRQNDITTARNDAEFYINEGDAENAAEAARELGRLGRLAIKAQANRERAAGIRAAYASVGMVRTRFGGWE
jgi:hypothetical protein